MTERIAYKEESDRLDFWSHWAEKLKEKTDYGEDYVDEQIARYRRHSTQIDDNPELWPAGSADFKRTLVKNMFKPLTDPSQKSN